MPSITLIESNGTEHTLNGETGQSIMQIALNAMVPGIQGDCGGACSCATCHAFVDERWRTRNRTCWISLASAKKTVD